VMERLTALQKAHIELYGGTTYVKHSVALATLAGEILLKPNGERVGLTIANGGLWDVALAFKRDTANAFQILLPEAIGLISLNALEDGELVTSEIVVVNAVGATSVFFAELIRKNTVGET